MSGAGQPGGAPPGSGDPGRMYDRSIPSPYYGFAADDERAGDQVYIIGPSATPGEEGRVTVRDRRTEVEYEVERSRLVPLGQQHPGANRATS